MKILGLGNALVDILVVLEDENLLSSLHLTKGDMHMINEKEQAKISHILDTIPHEMATGGSSANTCLALAHLQDGVGYASFIGKDAHGDFFCQTLKQYGIETRLTLCEKPTGTANTFITPDGERTFATHLGAASLQAPATVNKELIGGYDLAHIEGYYQFTPGLLETVCRTAKEHNVQVSIDLSSFTMVAEHRDEMQRIVKQYVDIVFANEEEAAAFTLLKNPQEAAKAIAEMCQLAVVKMGGKGACAACHGQGLEVIPGEKVHVVDTTAAGDFFAGGFLHGYSMGWPLRDCLKAGSRTAEMVIQVVGTQVTPQMWTTLCETLKSYGTDK